MTWRCAGIAAVCALAAMMSPVAAVAADAIDVILDQAQIVRLPDRGAVLLQKAIQVQDPYNVVVIYRGVDRESYSCAPKCERRITLGDTKDYFDSTLNQTGSGNGQASGAGPAAGQK
jgi:hypothetical protein